MEPVDALIASNIPREAIESTSYHCCSLGTPFAARRSSHLTKAKYSGMSVCAITMESGSYARDNETSLYSAGGRVLAAPSHHWLDPTDTTPAHTLARSA
jgi:hypothetical protein